MPTETQRRQTIALTRDWVRSDRSFRQVGDQIVSHLRSCYDHYNWIGIYMMEGDVLRLWSWDGPAATQHTEIPLHAGVCGWAASTGEIANVPDVSQDERYLECFLHTRSEIVVPITVGGRVYGEIDIDSDALAAFTEADERFLTEVCGLLGEKAAAEQLEGRAVAG